MTKADSVRYIAGTMISGRFKLLVALTFLGLVFGTVNGHAAARTHDHIFASHIPSTSPVNMSVFDPSEAHAMVMPQNEDRSIGFKTAKTRFIKDLVAALELHTYESYQYDPLVCLFHAQLLGQSTSLRAPPRSL